MIYFDLKIIEFIGSKHPKLLYLILNTTSPFARARSEGIFSKKNALNHRIFYSQSHTDRMKVKINSKVPPSRLTLDPNINLKSKV